jgi:hypothetical protein
MVPSAPEPIAFLAPVGVPPVRRGGHEFQPDLERNAAFEAVAKPAAPNDLPPARTMRNDMISGGCEL